MSNSMHRHNSPSLAVLVNERNVCLLDCSLFTFTHCCNSGRLHFRRAQRHALSLWCGRRKCTKSGGTVQGKISQQKTSLSQMFVIIHQRLGEIKSLRLQNHAGCSRYAWTVDADEAVLNCIQEQPSTSTRAIAKAVRTSRSNVWRILHDQQLYPYHPTRVHDVGPADFAPRVQFCQWILNQCLHQPNFLNHVLFTHEAQFNWFNCRNSHVWADEDPNVTVVGYHQEQFSVSV
jgi:hypothetical protein